MPRQAREFKEWAEGHGWVFEGIARNGHMILSHERAGRVQVSSTPSDWRTVENEKRRLLREVWCP